MAKKSRVGVVVDQVRARRTAEAAQPKSYLHGWKECSVLPSVDDFNRAYGNAVLLRDRELEFVSGVARTIEGYRSAVPFPENDGGYFGVVFFKRHGSFFFVFGTGEERTVRLFYMGVESDVEKHCSKIASEFDFDFEDAYFDLRDATIGRFGIPPEGGS